MLAPHHSYFLIEVSSVLWKVYPFIVKHVIRNGCATALFYAYVVFQFDLSLVEYSLLIRMKCFLIILFSGLCKYCKGDCILNKLHVQHGLLMSYGAANLDCIFPTMLKITLIGSITVWVELNLFHKSHMFL